MAYQQTYICDGCGVAKQESNHWLVATANTVESGNANFYPWIALEAVADGTNHYAKIMKTTPCPIYHFCGIGCATKKLASVVEGWNK